MSDTIYTPPSWAICRVCLHHSPRHRLGAHTLHTIVLRLGRCLDWKSVYLQARWFLLLLPVVKGSARGVPPLGCSSDLSKLFPGPQFASFIWGKVECTECTECTQVAVENWATAECRCQSMWLHFTFGLWGPRRQVRTIRGISSKLPAGLIIISIRRHNNPNELAIAARHLGKRGNKTKTNKNTTGDASLTRRIGLVKPQSARQVIEVKGTNPPHTWVTLFVLPCSCFANLRSSLFHCRFSLNPVRAVVLHRFPEDTDTRDDKLENSFQGIPWTRALVRVYLYKMLPATVCGSGWANKPLEKLIALSAFR